MKKTIAVLSLVLMLVMAVPAAVFAASPVAPLPATVNVAGSAVPAGAILQVTEAPASVATSMKSAQETMGIEGTMISVVDINMTGATGAATIRVDCPGLHANGAVVVLHQTGSGVEVIKAICYEGYFTFTTSSFSPFAFVLQSAGTAPASPAPGDAPTSPSTGVYSL